MSAAVAAGTPVYVVEGEKDVATLELYGLCGTTLVGGAKAPWLPQYRSALTGAHIVVFPDNDAPGEAHGTKVAQAVHGVVASLKVVRLPGLPPKGDVTAWLDAGHTLAELHALVASTAEYAPTTPPAAAPAANEDTAGNRNRVHIYWRSAIDDIVAPRQLIKGYLTTASVALFIGPSEAGKSTIAVDVACKVSQHYPVVYVAGEDAGNVRTQIRAWELTNQRQRGQLGLVDGPILLGNDVSVDDFLNTVLPIAPRLIVIDTLSSCIPGLDENSSALTGVSFNLNRIADATGATVLALHHPLKYDGGTFRGHSSLLNNTHTMWIADHDAGDGVVTLKVTRHKVKRAEPAHLQLIIRPTDITDPDDGVLSAPVAVPASRVQRSPDDPTTRQRAILEYLLGTDAAGGATSGEIVKVIAAEYRASEGRVRLDVSSLVKRDMMTASAKQRDPRLITEKGREVIKRDLARSSDQVLLADPFVINQRLNEALQVGTAERGNLIGAPGATFSHQDAEEPKPDRPDQHLIAPPPIKLPASEGELDRPLGGSYSEEAIKSTTGATAEAHKDPEMPTETPERATHPVYKPSVTERIKRITATRALLRDYGTHKELSLNLDALSWAHLCAMHAHLSARQPAQP